MTRDDFKTLIDSGLHDVAVEVYVNMRDSYNEAVYEIERFENALNDITSADETSTLAGAVAIAEHALESVRETRG